MFKIQSYAAAQSKAPLKPFTIERRAPNDHDVVIDIHYCGICHSDIHQARDEWGGSIFPMVPGHEISGIVSQVGKKVKGFKVGDSVGVGCFVDSCRHCEPCEQGLEQYCAQGMTGTYNGVERDTKKPTYGGYSEKIVVDENYVLNIPSDLPLAAAAPLLCAGITLYSPLKHWKAGPGKKVAIIGLGGLGHMGVKIAHAMGAEVSVLGHSANKASDAKTFGAHQYYLTSDPATFEKLKGTFDLIINTVSAGIDWNQYLNLLKIDGQMVVVGIPDKPAPINSFALIMGRRSLAGSLIGGIKETQEMLDFCSQHQITPEIEIIPMEQVNHAFERVLKSDVRYRFVLDIKSFSATK